MKKIIIFIFVSFFIFSFLFPAENKKVGILIQKEQTATYDETMQGLTDYLKTKNLDTVLDIKNAKNNKETMKSISLEYLADKRIDVIVVLGSSAVTVVNENVKSKPVIFGGINHPDGLGVKGTNITGTTYYIKPKSMLSLIKQILPKVSKAGILYEPPEQNAASKVEVPEMETALKSDNIVCLKESVTTANEIEIKAAKLISNGVQIIILPTNALLYNNIQTIRKITDTKKIPLASFSMEGIKNGALFGLTSDNIKLGEYMGEMIFDLLNKNKTVSNIPYKFPDEYKIVININAKKELGTDIPVNILKIATIIK